MMEQINTPNLLLDISDGDAQSNSNLLYLPKPHQIRHMRNERSKSACSQYNYTGESGSKESIDSRTSLRNLGILCDRKYSQSDSLPWTYSLGLGASTEFGIDEAGRLLHPIEGIWRLISEDGFGDYLQAIGVKRMMANMALNSDCLLTIHQEVDKSWKICQETSIRAKNMRGYRTRNYKLTSNKMFESIPKPEVLEDWDPRLVVTTLELPNDFTIKLEQVAEQDQKHRTSSSIVYEVPPNNDVPPMDRNRGVTPSDASYEKQGGVSTLQLLVATYTTSSGVTGVRKFIRHYSQHIYSNATPTECLTPSTMIGGGGGSSRCTSPSYMTIPGMGGGARCGLSRSLYSIDNSDVEIDEGAN